MKIDAFNSNNCKTGDPFERKHSLSLMMALGMMLANGARADARDKRERLQRQLERAENDMKQSIRYPTGKSET